MITPRRALGNFGEDAVVALLIKRGFSILARNFATQRGEVDIIAGKNNTIAFIEVKTRKTVYFPISNTVTYTKQRKIISAAQTFVLRNNIHQKVLRFDVAIVTQHGQELEVALIENAFTSE